MSSLSILSAVLVTIASSAVVNGAINCSAINDPSVKTFTMRLPQTKIPNIEMTTLCRKFLLPSDSTYDIIAIEPIFNNPEVVDRVEILACYDDPNVYSTNDTHECGFQDLCLNNIGYWEPGLSGSCMNNQYGIRIGQGGFQYAELGVRVTNRQLKSNLTDSSGVIIYYTNNTRQYPGGNIVGAQFYLDIPPGQQSVTAAGSCASDCTKRFQGPIYLTSAFLYMQFIGISGNIALYRNGSLVRMLHSVSNYDYLMPTRTEFQTPIQMMPGDEIRTTCVYNSASLNTTTNYGNSASSEECAAILSYYPLINNFLYCAQWKSTIYVCGNVDNIIFLLCDAPKFIQLSQTLTSGPCSQDCETASCGEIMNEIYATGCLNQADIRNYLRFAISNFVPVLANCEFSNPMSSTCSTNRPCTTMQASQSSRLSSYNTGVLLAIMALYYTT